MEPVLLQIGRLNIYTHGVFAVLGIVAASAAIYLFARKEYDCAYLFDNIIYSVLAGIIGARITFFLLYSDQFSSLEQILFLWEGGLVSFGGFAAGGIVLATLLKAQRQPVAEWLDMFSLGFPLGLALGRIGEVISGENFSDPGVPGAAANRFASVNFYEAVWCLIIFFILLGLRSRLKEKAPGYLLTATILLYSGGRFIIDFWRISDNFFLIFSLSQLASFVCFAIALVMIPLGRKLKQKG